MIDDRERYRLRHALTGDERDAALVADYRRRNPDDPFTYHVVMEQLGSLPPVRRGCVLFEER